MPGRWGGWPRTTSFKNAIREPRDRLMSVTRMRLCSAIFLAAILGAAIGLWRRPVERRGIALNFRRIADYHEACIFDDGDGWVTIQGLALHQNRFGQHIFDEVLITIIPDDMGPEAADELMSDYRRRIKANQDWHKAMRQKYLWAADHPWLPVEADPKEPPLPGRPDLMHARGRTVQDRGTQNKRGHQS
jgi:hypothetical protein